MRRRRGGGRRRDGEAVYFHLSSSLSHSSPLLFVISFCVVQGTVTRRFALSLVSSSYFLASSPLFLFLLTKRGAFLTHSAQSRNGYTCASFNLLFIASPLCATMHLTVHRDIIQMCLQQKQGHGGGTTQRPVRGERTKKNRDTEKAKVNMK